MARPIRSLEAFMVKQAEYDQKAKNAQIIAAVFAVHAVVLIYIFFNGTSLSKNDPKKKQLQADKEVVEVAYVEPVTVVPGGGSLSGANNDSTAVNNNLNSNTSEVSTNNSPIENKEINEFKAQLMQASRENKERQEQLAKMNELRDYQRQVQAEIDQGVQIRQEQLRAEEKNYLNSSDFKKREQETKQFFEQQAKERELARAKTEKENEEFRKRTSAVASTASGNGTGNGNATGNGRGNGNGNGGGNNVTIVNNFGGWYGGWYGPWWCQAGNQKCIAERL